MKYKIRFLFICLYFFLLNNLSALEISDQIYSENECYTIVDVLGEGVFGKVFAIEDTKGQKFALKAYKCNMSFKHDFYSDMEREFERGQVLDHPNIIKSYACFASSSTSDEYENYLILQLVEGSNLRRLPFKSISPEEAKRAAKHFIEALIYAYNGGFLNLDLHRGNVMINQDHDIMIIDLASFFTYEELKIAMESESSSETVAADVSVRVGKIRKFLSENPVLFKKLHETMQNKSIDTKEIKKRIKAFLIAYNFDDITDITRFILDKSSMSIEEKIDFSIKVKTLAWRFLYNVEEGEYLPLEDQFQDLLNVL